MEYTQIAKQAIEMQKMSFSSWYDTMASLQDQAVSAMGIVLRQNTWLPEEGYKAMQSWINAYQQERGRFKSYVDESFSDMEKYMSTEAQLFQNETKNNKDAGE